MTGGEYGAITTLTSLLNGIFYAVVFYSVAVRRRAAIFIVIAAVMLIGISTPKHYIDSPGYTTEETAERWRKDCLGISVIYPHSPLEQDAETPGTCYGLIY
jgi:hypothetical protein